MSLWGKKSEEIGSTQDYLKFAEIRDSIIITRKGELRAIIMVSSINFALKSEQEQDAIVFAYQNFLNSMNFPIQIVMQSKKLDLSKYLTKLKQASKNQTNELLRMQTIDYIDFIERLIKIANIMDKKFFVVIPFTPPPKIQPAAKNFKGIIKNAQTPELQITLDEFNTWKQELKQRVEVIQSGLGSVGIRSAQLNTQQIIELLYEIYNPEEASKEKLAEAENLTAEVVESELEKPVSPSQGGPVPKEEEENA